MSHNVADLHRSRLEALLALEIEFQRKTVALSNQRITLIKRLLSSVDELHTGGTVGDLLDATPSQEVVAPPPSKAKKKKKHKKAQPPTKAVRVVTGKAPRLIDAIQMVMRNKHMKANQVHDLLKARNWLPNSKDPLGYIRFTLSSEGDIFQRTEGERGVYHLDEANPYYSGKATPSTSKPTRKKSGAAQVEESSPASSRVVVASEPDESEDQVEVLSHEESLGLVDELIEGKIQTE